MTTRRPRRLGGIVRDGRATTAVEFALVVWPFLFVLLTMLQMGIYYMTQSALDSG